MKQHRAMWTVGIGVAFIALFIFIAVRSRPQPQTGDAPTPDDDFTSTMNSAAKSVNNGFVFFDGEYLQTPYKVTSKKGWILINNKKIRKVCNWPIKDPDTTKPTVPTYSKDNTFDDLGKGGGRRIDGRYLRWLRQQNKTHDEVMDGLVEFYKTLPFVAKVERIGVSKIYLTEVSGKLHRIGIESKRGAPLTREQQLAGIEWTRGMFEERLSKDDCYIFLSGMELSFGRMKSARDLLLMTDVLESDRATDDKLSILRRMCILPKGNEKLARMLVNKFKHSEQLRQRLAKLRADSGIEPRSLADIPPIPPYEKMQLR